MGATSLLPAKREVKREVGKAWQAWPGKQTSWKSLVRSLFGRGWAKCNEAVESGSLLAEKCFLHESILAPFSPFYMFWATHKEEKGEVFSFALKWPGQLEILFEGG